MLADDIIISPLNGTNNIANNIEETLHSAEDYCKLINLKINKSKTININFTTKSSNLKFTPLQTMTSSNFHKISWGLS